MLCVRPSVLRRDERESSDDFRVPPLAVDWSRLGVSFTFVISATKQGVKTTLSPAGTYTYTVSC